jgi:hypothetical protein
LLTAAIVGSLACGSAAWAAGETAPARGVDVLLHDTIGAGEFVPLGDTKAKVSAKANVLVVYATDTKVTKGKKGIDKRIGDVPQLLEAPFSAWDSFELLEKTDVLFSSGKNGKPGTMALPNKRKLTLKLNELEERYDVTLTITTRKGTRILDTTVKARKDEIFFVAGPKYKEGILVLGFRIGPG